MSDLAQNTLVVQANLGGHPEAKADSAITPEVPVKATDVEIVPDAMEVSPELAEHVKEVESGEIQLPGPINVGIHQGQPVMIQPAVPQQPNVILPLAQDDFVAGTKQPVSSSWRWLSEFVKRIILMMPGRTVYR